MTAAAPAFLGPPVRLRLSHAHAAAFFSRLFAISADRGQVASFVLFTQEEDNWCWAAIMQSFRPHLSQTAIATAHVQASGRALTCTGPDRVVKDQGDCTPSGCDTACNGLHSLSAVLTENNLLRRLWTGSNRLTFSDVVTEVARERAVPCRLSWGHLIAIQGWRRDGSGGEFVSVSDPLSNGAPGPPRPATVREYPFEEVMTRYSAGRTGSVTHAYSVV